MGTTHSLVARVSKGMNDDISNVRIDVILNETGGDVGRLVPSVVTFDPDGDLKVGHFAAYGSRGAKKFPDCTFYDAKRILAKKIDNPHIVKYFEFWPF